MLNAWVRTRAGGRNARLIVMDIMVLEREIYSEAEAARLLRVAQSTLHYWLEGDVRRGKRYTPIIRKEPKGSRSVTWAEFVEAGLLRQYRREHQVPMPELRVFIDTLREKLGVPYPLARQSRSWASGDSSSSRPRRRPVWTPTSSWWPSLASSSS
jgi:hypothetical protein